MFEQKMIAGPFGFWTFPLLHTLISILCCPKVCREVNFVNVSQAKERSAAKPQITTTKIQESPVYEHHQVPDKEESNISEVESPMKSSRGQTSKHIPYNVTRTLNAGETIVENVKEDYLIGLGTEGRSGNISNSGLESLEMKIFDGTYWSDWITITSGATKQWYFEDNIWLHTMKLRAAKTGAATYDLTINPGLK